MTQCDMVLAYIAEHGSITALEADDALGVRRLAARIADLRDQGHDITVTKNRRYAGNIVQMSGPFGKR